MDRHPGGPTTIVAWAGKDASKFFNEIHKGVKTLGGEWTVEYTTTWTDYVVGGPTWRVVRVRWVVWGLARVFGAVFSRYGQDVGRVC